MKKAYEVRQTVCGGEGEIETEAGPQALHPVEIDIRLAIADYLIRRIAGTGAGKEVFDALIPRYESRFPHHKILSNYLLTQEYFDAVDDSSTSETP
ncbi:MAG TPA: hypothetical protein VJS90_18415 [Pseudomonas sp.]|uniref:hypothetical protein n=1 Tax=Pseudomonas sp. TaxID=306 RepID=UPI002B4A4FEB|nr:hypothetical protein [Pseudomonas sp.]HKS15009.1 hypothetical protein [Pseudomonas sp.]